LSTFSHVPDAVNQTRTSPSSPPDTIWPAGGFSRQDAALGTKTRVNKTEAHPLAVGREGHGPDAAWVALVDPQALERRRRLPQPQRLVEAVHRIL
jgi:hypothetical protein